MVLSQGNVSPDIDYANFIEYPDGTAKINVPYDGLFSISFYSGHFNTCKIFINGTLVAYLSGCDSDYQVPYSLFVKTNDVIDIIVTGGRGINKYIRLFKMK